MRVRVLIHLEGVTHADRSSPWGFAWWGECPEVSGYSVAADHLPELLSLAESGLPKFVGLPVEIEWRLVPNEVVNEGSRDASARDGVSTSIASHVEVPIAV